MLYLLFKHLTIDELSDIMKNFRASCQSRFDAGDELIDGMNLGQFPKDPTLMVYIFNDIRTKANI